MLTRLKMHGVIAACGSTSTYNSGAPSVMQSEFEPKCNRPAEVIFLFAAVSISY